MMILNQLRKLEAFVKLFNELWINKIMICLKLYYVQKYIFTVSLVATIEEIFI